MIDYLLIGHVTVDLTPNGPVPGGAVTFASRVATVLGYRTAVLTSAARDYDLHQALPDGVDVVCLPSERSTTFENVYAPDGSRRQTIYAVARTIRAEDVPAEWRDAKIVHMAPVAEEIDTDIASIFPGSAIGLTPQGWLRGWDEQGRVFAERGPHVRDLLPRTSAIVVSREDLVSLDQVEAALAITPLIVVTDGAKGCVVYYKGETRSFTPPTSRSCRRHRRRRHLRHRFLHPATPDQRPVGGRAVRQLRGRTLRHPLRSGKQDGENQAGCRGISVEPASLRPRSLPANRLTDWSA